MTKNADRIYVMDNGKIVEVGIHEDLMRVNGKYASMFKSQSEKYELGIGYN